jgi:hypothetical protein
LLLRNLLFLDNPQNSTVGCSWKRSSELAPTVFCGNVVYVLAPGPLILLLFIKRFRVSYVVGTVPDRFTAADDVLSILHYFVYVSTSYQLIDGWLHSICNNIRSSKRGSVTAPEIKP